jgi:hypothetical protein
VKASPDIGAPTPKYRLWRGVALLLMGLAAGPAIAGDGRGELCVAALGQAPEEKFPVDRVEVRVDRFKPVSVTRTRGARVDGLDMDKRHWVRIRARGKTIQSFRIGFQPGVGRLLLRYSPSRGTWRFRPQLDPCPNDTPSS